MNLHVPGTLALFLVPGSGRRYPAKGREEGKSVRFRLHSLKGLLLIVDISRKHQLRLCTRTLLGSATMTCRAQRLVNSSDSQRWVRALAVKPVVSTLDSSETF